MFDNVKNAVGEGFAEFRRTAFNQGYLDYIVRKENEKRQLVDEQLSGIVGRLAAASTRSPNEMSDEAHLFRDQMFELERGRISIEHDSKELETMSDSVK